uniref:Uncharacterized protein n=1 Tax=Mus musculus TaxID=10090 RepID=Q3V3J8_MOUSE|nr:unnamed protein product [Mus musculus]
MCSEPPVWSFSAGQLFVLHRAAYTLLDMTFEKVNAN